MSTNEEYDDMIVKGQPNDKDSVINKYLNMNIIFDVGTNDKHCGTVVVKQQAKVVGKRAPDKLRAQENHNHKTRARLKKRARKQKARR